MTYNSSTQKTWTPARQALQRRKNFRNITQMTGLILTALGYPSGRLRDLACAVQSLKRESDEHAPPDAPFRTSGPQLGALMGNTNPDNDRAEGNAATYAIDLHRAWQAKTGIVVFAINGVRVPVNDPSNSTDHPLNCLEIIDYLTPIADAAWQRYCANPRTNKESWKEARKDAVAWAVQLFPRQDVPPIPGGGKSAKDWQGTAMVWKRGPEVAPLQVRVTSPPSQTPEGWSVEVETEDKVCQWVACEVLHAPAPEQSPLAVDDFTRAAIERLTKMFSKEMDAVTATLENEYYAPHYALEVREQLLDWFAKETVFARKNWNTKIAQAQSRSQRPGDAPVSLPQVRENLPDLADGLEPFGTPISPKNAAYPGPPDGPTICAEFAFEEKEDPIILEERLAILEGYAHCTEEEETVPPNAPEGLPTLFSGVCVEESAKDFCEAGEEPPTTENFSCGVTVNGTESTNLVEIAGVLEETRGTFLADDPPALGCLASVGSESPSDLFSDEATGNDNESPTCFVMVNGAEDLCACPGADAAFASSGVGEYPGAEIAAETVPPSGGARLVEQGPGGSELGLTTPSAVPLATSPTTEFFSCGSAVNSKLHTDLCRSEGVPSASVTMSLLAWALALVARGWAIFPLHTPNAQGVCDCAQGVACRNAGKHPRTANGLKAATTDVAQVRQWWARWPHANVGIATGPLSNLVVLDVDLHKGGAEGLAEVHQQLGDDLLRYLEAAPEVLTGGDGVQRGRQYYFHYAGNDVPNSAGRLGTGLDVRGRGGYVVAPPSHHKTGVCYEWYRVPEVVPELPEPLRELMLPPARGAVVNSVWAELPAYYPRPSLDDCGPIGEGQRNDTLFRRVACVARAKGLGYHEIRRELELANGLCRPPLPSRELETIARSAMKYPVSKHLRKSYEVFRTYPR